MLVEIRTRHSRIQVMRFVPETAGGNFGSAVHGLICGGETARPHGTIPFDIEKRIEHKS